MTGLRDVSSGVIHGLNTRLDHSQLQRRVLDPGLGQQGQPNDFQNAEFRERPRRRVLQKRDKMRAAVR
jgi:hypothetical protein